MDRIYNKGTIEGNDAVWVSVLYAVLALGTLRATNLYATVEERDRDGICYLENSIQQICTLTDSMNVNHATSALLISMYLYEVNLKSAAWIWEGTAVRIGYEVGLHRADTKYPIPDNETRMRLWWSLFAWDR